MRSFANSNALVSREKTVAPLAAQTFSKSYRYFVPGAAPMYIDHGEGARLYDVDGNVYLDFICALGPIILGYNYRTSLCGNSSVSSLSKSSLAYLSIAMPMHIERELASKTAQNRTLAKDC